MCALIVVECYLFAFTIDFEMWTPFHKNLFNVLSFVVIIAIGTSRHFIFWILQHCVIVRLIGMHCRYYQFNYVFKHWKHLLFVRENDKFELILKMMSNSNSMQNFIGNFVMRNVCPMKTQSIWNLSETYMIFDGICMFTTPTKTWKINMNCAS